MASAIIFSSRIQTTVKQYWWRSRLVQYKQGLRFAFGVYVGLGVGLRVEGFGLGSGEKALR